MELKPDLDGTYAPSDDIVARLIAGELIIVPLVAGIGDMEDELFTLNESGRAIWEKLDGRTSLRQVAHALAEDYASSEEEIQRDVVGFTAELLNRRMLVRASPGATGSP